MTYMKFPFRHEGLNIFMRKISTTVMSPIKKVFHFVLSWLINHTRSEAWHKGC